MDPWAAILVVAVVVAFVAAAVTMGRTALAPGRIERDAQRRERPLAVPRLARRATPAEAEIVDVRPPAAWPEPDRSESAPRAPDVEALIRLESRLASVEREIADRFDRLGDDLRRGRETLAALVAAAENRQQVALERTRADIQREAAERPVALPLGPIEERRLDVVADLYARLARLESAVAQVTNPILLPGEAYAPPTEFLADALAWENWKDVGERAFALADCFSAQRLLLTDGTRAEVAAFVTTLRGVLTRSVYPNLVPDPTPQQTEALRGALTALAAELPRARRALETEFQRVVSPTRSLPDGNPTGR